MSALSPRIGAIAIDIHGNKGIILTEAPGYPGVRTGGGTELGKVWTCTEPDVVQYCSPHGIPVIRMLFERLKTIRSAPAKAKQ